MELGEDTSFTYNKGRPAACDCGWRAEHCIRRRPRQHDRPIYLGANPIFSVWNSKSLITSHRNVQPHVSINEVACYRFPRRTLLAVLPTHPIRPSLKNNLGLKVIELN